jgi:hypothetical protein
MYLNAAAAASFKKGDFQEAADVFTSAIGEQVPICPSLSMLTLLFEASILLSLPITPIAEVHTSSSRTTLLL